MSRPTDWHEVFGFGDPTPGDPVAIRRVARELDSIGDVADSARTRLLGLLGDNTVMTWIGQAGDAFRATCPDLPAQLEKCGDSYGQAASAMYRWADLLSTHQGAADRALVSGRSAQLDLESAQRQLTAALSSVDAASHASALHPDRLPDDLKPTDDEIRRARGRYQAAEQARSNAEGLVSDAQARLDAARRLAEDAGELRQSDARDTARRIGDAADAGIEPRSRWEKFTAAVAGAWEVIVEVAKIVVAVLGVVVLIIGGPLAWVVLAAALIVLVDTLMKYANGEASLLDVGLAALACIPGTKGLTTFAELSAAFKMGGSLGALTHIGVALKGAAVNLVASARMLRSNFMPGMRTIGQVLGDGLSSGTMNLRTSLASIRTAFTQGRSATSTMSEMAQAWQGTRPFAGVDDYVDVTLSAGQRLEAGFPGLSNYAVDAGTAANHGHSAASVWESVQVGPSLDGAHDAYRGSMVTLEIAGPTPAATGTTLANPQFGAGGETQFFLDIKDGIASGNISVLDGAGNPISIPAGTTAGQVNDVVSNALGGTGTIQLTGANAPNFANVMSQGNIKNTPTGQLILQSMGYGNAAVGAVR